jgi:HAE1 family hydrophobic/amphiphilic exporter-1
MRAAVGGVVVSKYRRAGQDDVDIRLITTDAFRATPGNLADLPILSSKGGLVHLGQLGTIVGGSAPTQIAHVNRERSITVNASANGRLVGSIQTEVQAKLARIPLPPGYGLTYQGQAAQGGSAFADIFSALGFALILMYMLMTMLFGSVTLPLAVLMSLPLAVVGALGAMALTQTPFTLFSLLGFAMLVGLVGKNAILLVDYTDILRKRGATRTEALLHAGPTRLRPIIMTTMSIIASLAPVALGVDAGSELLKAAALVLAGGLLTSTILTLVFVPAMYTIFDDIQEFIGGIVNRIIRPRPMEPAELIALRRVPLVPTNGVVNPTAILTKDAV